MLTTEPEHSAIPNAELEKMLGELLATQQTLGENIMSTSQFLRFVLNLANENLTTIRLQLEKIRDLAEEIEQQDTA